MLHGRYIKKTARGHDMTTQETRSCVLFADICGTSRLYEKLGDTEALRAIERCLNRMERAAAGYKGRVVKTHGDELMAVFDDVEAALHAAIEMQQRIDALPPVSGLSLAIRVGFHYGLAPEADNDTFVATVNVAARVVTMGRPGQILATAEAVQALPGNLREQTGEIDVPDGSADAAIRVFEVKWQQGGDESRHQSVPIPAAAPAATGPSKVRLKLRYGEHRLMLGPDNPTAILGRDVHADIVVKDARASRNHGRIERRYDRFFLVDQSTNGTYVTMRGEPEFLLRQEETVLRGRGRIAFGHTGDNNDALPLEFEVVDHP